MFKDIKTIPWDKLQHAYGSAGDVPAKIIALASRFSSKRKNALWELYGNIFHQGSRFQATSYAVPFLVELLEDVNIREREKIIIFLVNIALGYEEEFLPYGVNPAQYRVDCSAYESQMSLDENEQLGVGQNVEIACYDAVLSHIETLTQLTNDSDISVRHAAVYLLAWFPECAEESISVLISLLEREPDLMFLPDLILAIGLLRRCGDVDISNKILSKYLIAKQPLCVRVAAAIALSSETSLNSEYIRVLLDGVMQTKALNENCKKMYFNEGDLSGYASLTLAKFGQQSAEEVIPVICQVLPQVTPYNSIDLTKSILELIRSGKNRPLGEMQAQELSTVEIDALRTIATNGGWELSDGVMFVNYSNLLESYGLPGNRNALLKYLDCI